MLRINDKVVSVGHFPDGTLLLKEEIAGENVEFTWRFENNEELVALMYLVGHARSHGVKQMKLVMPYIPNARQDRVKKDCDVFTLKYFTEMINAMGFDEVRVLDPHSNVSAALIDRIKPETPKRFVNQVVKEIKDNMKESDFMMFYPDEGAMKRYSEMFDAPYAFGIKKRDWATGEILGLDVSGMTEHIQGATVLIVDDICSRGGTFLHSAKKLKELGAKNVYLYISHCENTILEGELLTTDYITKIYTTNSIFTADNAENSTVNNIEKNTINNRIEVLDYDEYKSDVID